MKQKCTRNAARCELLSHSRATDKKYKSRRRAADVDVGTMLQHIRVHVCCVSAGPSYARFSE